MTSLAALELTLGVDGMIELRALARTLERAEGFTLVFAQCNDFGLRDRIIEQLRAMLPERGPLVVALPAGVADVRSALLDSLPPDRPRSLFVTGLENSLDSRSDFHPVLANLNATRNELPEEFPFAVVFWLPEFALRLVAQQAPDFWSWRSAAYAFLAPHEEGLDVAARLLDLGVEALVNLPLDEKRDRLSAIQRLLSEYGEEDGTAAERGPRARLLHQAGVLSATLGDFAGAQRELAEAAYLSRQVGDLRRVAASLHQLGVVHQRLGEYEQARQRYEEALTIARGLRDRGGTAATLHQLGRLHYLQGEHEQARERYEEALAIAQERGDRFGTTRCLHQLGMLHHDRGEFDQARRYYEEVLAVAKESGDKSAFAASLHQLGRLRQSLGEYEQARDHYQRALAIARELGDQWGVAAALGQLGGVAEDAGEYARAVTLSAQAFAIFTELSSPDREIAGQALVRLRDKMGTEAFNEALQQAGIEAEDLQIEDRE